MQWWGTQLRGMGTLTGNGAEFKVMGKMVTVTEAKLRGMGEELR